MKTTDIGFERFPEDFYADPSTAFIAKQEDYINYLKNKFGNILKEGTRVIVHLYKKHGTVKNVGEWKNKLAYTVLMDGDPDCFIFYPEDFDVLEV